MWTSHLNSEEEKDKFREYILNSTSLWERLGQIIEEKAPKTVPKDYDKGSWAYYQADQLGYQRALNDILMVLPLDK
jgi:hypothetical protein|tara:strand:- start:108 stop:335 length:228 start_codon:yes stop_codon:yes gene_type:complete